jgi:hypothetical protein
MSVSNIIRIDKKLPMQITSGLLSKYMHYKKIPESLLNMIELINISLFKYINQEQINEKSAEQKLMYINNIINDILYNNKEFQTQLKNSSAKLRKSNYHLTTLEHIRNKTNPDILNEIEKNNLIKFRLKKKLKNDHDKYIVKEMEYLQRISELQSQVNLYEKTLDELTINNNNNDNLNNNSDIDNDNIKVIRNKSAKSLPVKSNKNLRYFRKKCNTMTNKNEINIIQPLSYSLANNSMHSLQGEVNQRFNQENSVSSLDSYLNSYKNINININNDNYKNKHLNFKYQVGNGYYRNKFIKLKKDIKEQNNYLQKVRDLLKEIK